MQIIDANVVLRYILNDNQKLALLAKNIIDDNSVEIPTEVLCEVVYVLQKVYKVPHNKIGIAIKNLIDKADIFIPHKNAIYKAFDYFAKDNLDFVDCILVAYAETENSKIHTFDKKLNKLISNILKNN